MRIGIDARILAQPKCGIGNYTYNLIKQYIKINNSCTVYLFSDNNFNPIYNFENIGRVYPIIFANSRKAKKKWLNFLPQKIKENKIDVYHATWNNFVPLKKFCPCVLTIHDLAPWILPGHFRNKRKEFRYKLRHFLSAHKADKIITDSYSSKKDIINLCRIKEDKIKVIYLGIEEEFDPNLLSVAEKNEILKKYGLNSKKYLIDPLGIDHPRRNPGLVLEAFANLLKSCLEDYYLVYTGNFYRDSLEYKKLKKRIEELNLLERVLITGWIPTKDLIAILSSAIVSIIPSLYEGFCLPLLESFVCKVPVIASNRGSIPEIAKDSAILIDPYDVNSLTEKLIQLLNNKELYSLLISKGLQRVKNFNWQKTAQRTLAIYCQLMDRK